MDDAQLQAYAKRFFYQQALGPRAAEEKDGTIAWTCRTMDLDPKYLPATCR